MPQALRRSPRLGGVAAIQAPRNGDIQAIPRKKRRTSRRESPPESQRFKGFCSEVDPYGAGSSQTIPITSAELSQREIEVSKRERELRRKSEKLQMEVAHAEEALLERAAEGAFAQLEEHFSCPLCFDIIACPYILTPAQCGHTFCALCTAKWFFSRLHRGCGGWHESVDCPMCRALLILTPETTPRSTITVPFTPNRLADSVLTELIKTLASRPKKCEESAPAGLDAWAEGGILRAEWLERDRLGRQEMDDIIGRWKTLNSEDFIDIKARLGV